MIAVVRVVEAAAAVNFVTVILALVGLLVIARMMASANVEMVASALTALASRENHATAVKSANVVRKISHMII